MVVIDWQLTFHWSDGVGRTHARVSDEIYLFRAGSCRGANCPPSAVAAAYGVEGLLKRTDLLFISRPFPSLGSRGADDRSAAPGARPDGAPP